MKSALGTVVMGMATLFAAGASRAAETELVNAQTPWRAFLVVGPRLETKTDGTLRYEEGRRGGGRGGSNPAVDLAGLNGEQSRFSRLPAAGWTQPGYDASPWARYLQSDLADFLGDYGVPRYSFDQRDKSWPALLCLRTTFGIADPAKAADLKVGVTGLGGAVVHVNGREVGRGFLPQGPLHALTPAEDYPVEAYTLDDGVTPLPELSLRTKPDPKQLPRYQRRIRTFTVSVPKEVLVKGANVVTVEIHPALVSGPMARFPWIHLGVHGITLTSASGAGVIPYAEALQGTRVWSANPEEQIAETPTPVSLIRRDEGRPVIWMRGRALRGIQCGNPFEPVLPVRMAVPRNGVASGQTVVTDLAGLRDVKAAMGVLKGPPGEIPASAVEVRYAVQHAAMHFCDAFLPAPPEGAKTVPVWVIVQAPKNQAPGWYTGALKVQANGQEFTVPVQVLVTGATLPDARDFTSHIGAASSPETLAAYYKVEPWSDQHLRLMEPSLRMAGQLGNDVLHVPVILGGM